MANRIKSVPIGAVVRMREGNTRKDLKGDLTVIRRDGLVTTVTNQAGEERDLIWTVLVEVQA